MPTPDSPVPPSMDLALRRLAVFAPIEAGAAALLQKGPGARRHPVGAALGDDSRRLLLVSGWACRCRILADGGRQIFSFLLPGDSVDLSSPELFRTECLTRAETVDLEPALGPAGATDPPRIRLRAVLAEAARAEHQRQLDHMVRLGSMPAFEAMADLLLEFHDRQAEVGLAEQGRFAMPLFQDVIGGALGLSPAHTSRVLSRLRREGLVSLKDGWVHLLDPVRLRALAAAFHAPPAEARERTSERRVRQAGQREARQPPPASGHDRRRIS
jgi:hypothetical protein